MAAPAKSTFASAPRPQAKVRPLRVAIICDFAEENWPSMDLVGDMLLRSLSSKPGDVTATRIQPRLPFSSGQNPDKVSRFLGRFLHYPREVRRIRNDFDLFHIVDHSYAHLARELPPGRTIVTCHDLDAFRCLTTPEVEPRNFAFKSMARRILSGFQRAAHVTCDTEATRLDILAHRLLPPERLTVVHNGVSPELTPNEDLAADAELCNLLKRNAGRHPELLHVGSTIPRKRIDVLLHVFAEVRQHRPEIRLLRVGGDFTSDQKALASSFGLLRSIDVLPRLDTKLLAAAYRRATLVLQPSESEGFGLPVIEAMACGTPVIASDIAPLREIGGNAVTFSPVGDIAHWTTAILHALTERQSNPAAWQLRRQNALAQAKLFSWDSYADQMLGIYRRVLEPIQ